MYDDYDPTKTVLGDLIRQYTGGDATDKFAGPVKVANARPFETSVSVPGIYPHVVRWSDKSGYYSTGTVAVSNMAVTGSGTSWHTAGVPIGARIGFGTTDPAAVTEWYVIGAIASNTSITLDATAGTIAGGTSFVIDMNYNIDWVFLGDAAATTTTRRITCYEFRRGTSVFTWRGFILKTYPTATNHTITGMRAVYAKYTTGTVGVSTATVTGSGTTWTDDRIAIGSRIGFGSTDPTQISTWYYINAVGSNTSITIQNNATAAGTGGTASNISISGGTAYVIEDLRVLTTTTNATATNGGLYMANGLSFDDFTPAGTTIAAATTVDKVKAIYWLADASTVTNDANSGLALDEQDSWTQQYCYVIERVAATTPSIYKYNFRAALSSISSGKTTSAFVFATGTQSVTGNVSATNNGRIGSLAHGPGSGVKSLFFVTATRVYRVAVANITNGSTTFLSDSMVEVATGGASTYTATGALTGVEISDQIDRLIVTSTGTAGARSYITKYNTNSDPFDHIFLIDSKQIDQSAADSNSVPHPSIQAGIINVWSEEGLTYISRAGLAAATNALYAVPLGADWEYADGSVKQRLITPSLATPNAEKYIRAYFNSAQYLGEGNLTIPTEPVRMYYRTVGISDDSGSWTLIDKTGDLASVEGAAAIQFAFEFRTIGTFCLPNRVYNVCVVYEDNTTDSHYQPSVAHSSTSGKVFAWRFSSTFGGTVPRLRIRLFNATTGVELIDDDTVSASFGTFEKSTNDGGAWGAYNTTDKGNETTYIRYTPASLADDIKVRALLTLY